MEVAQLEISKSLPQTPARKLFSPVFRTVPGSPTHLRPSSSDDEIDLEILTHKLQLHQLELEEARLRIRQKKAMEAKQAADVAAAQRFRDGLASEPSIESTGKKAAGVTLRSKSISLGSARNSRAPTNSKFVRSKRPDTLMLSATSNVEPQEIQSAALPTLRTRTAESDRQELKRHWRRTTISAGRTSASKIILISQGKEAEYNFEAELPPVPQLSASTATSSPTMSPLTPQPTEDQIRRELETFALEEGPDFRSRRNSTASRKRLPAAFIPSEADRMVPKRLVSPETPTALVELPDISDPKATSRQNLSRKKSFFSRFERKDDVDILLDLYLTDEQLVEHKMDKRKSTKSRRQTFFKRWNPSEHDGSRSLTNTSHD